MRGDITSRIFYFVADEYEGMYAEWCVHGLVQS